MNPGRAYRPDIDGLRAIAVLSVVFYHFGVPFFPGGFTGVDVFFVISGYLITSIIRPEVASGTFSFATFYRRRVRRIVPALAAVLIVSTVIACVLLFPTRLTSFGESLVASALGIANIYFYLNSGYFDQAAETLPLLHMWSLAIEEQFYLFWPVALLLLARAGRNLDRRAIVFLACVMLASFAWAEATVFDNSQASFFMPHLRAWELAAGSLIAFLPAVRSRITAEAASVAGLGLIAIGIGALSRESLFPGHNALLPCVGSALVIWPKQHETWVARLLSIRPAVWTGLISYSLYLWHWPILVFFVHWNSGKAPGPKSTIALLLLALGVSVLSWFFVEQPFRRPGRALHLQWPAALGALGVAALAGVLLVGAHGLPSRVPSELRGLEAFLDYERPPVPAEICSYNSPDDGAPPARCERPIDGRPRALMLGDSHAAHFVAALSPQFPRIHFSYAEESSCRPVPVPHGRKDCVQQVLRMYKEVIPREHFDYVILSARWSNGDWQQVGEAVRYLKRHVRRVIVFGQIQEYTAELPEILLGGILPRHYDRGSVEEASLRSSLAPINAEIRKAAEAAGAVFYDPLWALCGNNGNCVTRLPDGTPVQYDYGHLTLEGADFILERFEAAGLFRRPLPAKASAT